MARIEIETNNFKTSAKNILKLGYSRNYLMDIVHEVDKELKRKRRKELWG